MKIETRGGVVCLIADAGMGVRRKSDASIVVESVSLSKTDSPDNWEDCPLPSDEATEADKDAALRRFGVEV